MTTPLYPTFKKRISDSVAQLLQDQVTPWAFFNSGKPFRVMTFGGREISYEVGCFQDSPREVFWSRYIEPFLEDLTVREVDAAVSSAREREVDAMLLLPEVQSLLRSGSRKVFSRMAQIDQRLMGNGYPKNVPLRRVEQEVQSMDQFVDERIRAELAMWKSLPNQKSKLERWYEKNKFWVWLIGTLIAIASLCVKLL
jgi:hypothetical protein